DIQITLKQMLRDFIGIRVNRAKKSGMVNITSSVNSRERSGINTILHELNPLFTINVDRKSGSAGMPRPTSYAVFCLKKKKIITLYILGRSCTPKSTLFPYTTLFRSDIQITLKQMLRDFIGIRVNRAKKSGMVNITSSVNSRERSGINTILHELNPLFTINVTMRDIKSKNVYSRVNSKATTQWRKTESANGVHLEGVASDNRSS